MHYHVLLYSILRGKYKSVYLKLDENYYQLYLVPGEDKKISQNTIISLAFAPLPSKIQTLMNSFDKSC